MSRRILIATVVLFAAVFAMAEANKRLVLKDGSFQPVQKYEIKGDRVRYYSADRFEWEEMPSDLVDWPATKKYEEDVAKGVSHTAEQIDKEVEEEKALDDAKTPEVAPNLRLPFQGGVLVLDQYNGAPQLLELSQSTSDINRDVKGNILRATVNPFASNKQKIEVAGAHAKTQIHVTRPTVYLNVEDPADVTATSSAEDSGPAPKPEDRYRFVRMEQKKDSRIVGNLNISMLGKMSQQQSFIATRGESIGGGWIKISPEQDLTPGEYAIVEMLSPKEMNLYVWDIGVNPNAPENPQAWKPEKPKPLPSKEPPKLQKREPPQ